MRKRMKEHKLIDATSFYEAEARRCHYHRPFVGTCTSNGVRLRDRLEEQPAIDVEALPIVKELREELEQARRDCAVAERNHAECVEKLKELKEELAKREEVVRAHWKRAFNDDVDIGDLVLSCSRCHCTVLKNFTSDLDFCPKCGAKMNEEVEQ